VGSGKKFFCVQRGQFLQAQLARSVFTVASPGQIVSSGGQTQQHLLLPPGQAPGILGAMQEFGGAVLHWQIQSPAAFLVAVAPKPHIFGSHPQSQVGSWMLFFPLQIPFVHGHVHKKDSGSKSGVLPSGQVGQARVMTAQISMEEYIVSSEMKELAD